MLKILVTAVLLFDISVGYRVLLVFPFPYRSHGILGSGFVRNLLEAGHEVTYITPFPLLEQSPKLHQVQVGNSGVLDATFNIKMLLEGNLRSDPSKIFNLMVNVARDVLADRKVQQLLNNTNQNYDVVIAEWMNTEIYSGKFSPIEEKAYRQYFEDAVKRRGRKLPDYNEIKYNASLAFSNSHISLRDVPELPLALKMIGGFHIETHIKPLPNNLQVIMNKSTNGVILFSMGTQLTTGGMPSELTNELLKAFGDLPYIVLWRFDDDQLKDIPDNIIVQSWIPQLSILAHPNCVLFITHGGLLSLTESIHTGVPIIGIPVFADQFLNVDTAVKNGYGRRVELSFTMSHVLREEINEVINNPQYSRKAKELSLIYHDRLVPPGVELVHWVEHVMKTRGAHHLRSPALHLPLYQKLYFDLLAFAILILFLFFILYRYIVIKLSYLKRKIKITFNMDYDIALILLNISIVFGATQQPIKIIEAGTELPAGTNVRAFGFGYRKGDFGGPLVLTSSQELIGLPSGTVYCETKLALSIYTNLANTELNNWITKHTSDIK
ncbi:unnamed protein product [Leptidea sinapis]|uniref:Uncharacterized protein n=1 Tax=Leptidea sinapis TaxID=189913 RepID=A0A5E4QHB1_9NEOP|nr:unnamed protein product [Leptidea sinapis]